MPALPRAPTTVSATVHATMPSTVHVSSRLAGARRSRPTMPRANTESSLSHTSVPDVEDLMQEAVVDGDAQQELGGVLVREGLRRVEAEVGAEPVATARGRVRQRRRAHDHPLERARAK